MIERRYVFPGVLEMNYQSQRRMGVNIYLIDGGTEFALIDVGFLDELPDVLELIRQMDFSLSACKMIVATHADVDHTQGLTRAREVLKCEVAAHPKSVAAIEEGDEILTYARIDAQGIRIPMPRCKVDRVINEGDVLQIGDKTLEVWSTPGHTAGQLALRMGQSALLGRQHLPRRQRRRHRRPPWLKPARIHRQPEADPRLGRRVSAPLAWTDLSQGQRPARRHDRAARGIHPHGRFRHLRRRLAAHGRVGRRAGPRRLGFD